MAHRGKDQLTLTEIYHRIIGIPKAISEAREIVRAARTNSAQVPIEELQFAPIIARKQMPRWAVGMEIARANDIKSVPNLINQGDMCFPTFLRAGLRDKRLSEGKMIEALQLRRFRQAQSERSLSLASEKRFYNNGKRDGASSIDDTQRNFTIHLDTDGMPLPRVKNGNKPR